MIKLINIIGLHHYLTYNPPMVLIGEKKSLTPYSDLQSPRKCSSFILLQVVDQFSQHHLLKRLSIKDIVYSCLLCQR